MHPRGRNMILQHIGYPLASQTFASGTECFASNQHGEITSLHLTRNHLIGSISKELSILGSSLGKKLRYPSIFLRDRSSNILVLAVVVSLGVRIHDDSRPQKNTKDWIIILIIMHSKIFQTQTPRFPPKVMKWQSHWRFDTRDRAVCARRGTGNFPSQSQ